MSFLNNQNKENNSLFDHYDFRNSNLLNQQLISNFKDQSSNDVIKITDEGNGVSNRDEEEIIQIGNNLSSIIEEDLMENNASISLNQLNSMQYNDTNQEKYPPLHCKSKIAK